MIDTGNLELNSFLVDKNELKYQDLKQIRKASLIYDKYELKIS